ncbi:MAG TPA: transporter associated domain-containing protein [Candidatus Binatia bacterium]|nr:transporter associated domain-containing protein [Candidatus Binatia bacterium]
MTLVAALALVPLLALRALAASAETIVATGPALRRRSGFGDACLASAARAAVQVSGAATVGIVTTLVWRHLGRAAVPPVLVMVVPALLVLLDLVPRGLAADVPPRSRRVVEIVLVGLAVVLVPILLVERLLAALLLGRRRGPLASLSSLRRLGSWLAARPARGPLDVSEAGLVARIARFTKKTVRDVLVPQVDLCAVADTASVGELVALVRERGFSRVPVFHDRLFNIVGIVASLDLLGVVDPLRPIASVVREPYFVPESKPLPDLLAALQTEGQNLAIVVDEYGGAVGLVTVEDVVEEIVGEIEDEYDAPQELVRRVAPGVFVMSARASVAHVNERFGWNLPQGEYETMGGLVLERLGRVPKPGDTVRVGRVDVEVTRATARAVLELRVRDVGLGWRAR